MANDKTTNSGRTKARSSAMKRISLFLLLSIVMAGCTTSSPRKAVPTPAQLDSLINFYENELTKDSLNYDVVYNLGEAYSLKTSRKTLRYWRVWEDQVVNVPSDRYAKAVMLLTRAARLNQKDERPYLSLARIFYDLDLDQWGDDYAKGKVLFSHNDRSNLRKAIEYCRKAINLNPNRTEAYLLMGLLWPRWYTYKYESYDSADYYFKEALRTQGKGNTLSEIRDEYSRQITMWRELIDLRIDDDVIRLDVGSAISEAGERIFRIGGSSYENFERKLKGVPTIAKSYYLLGMSKLWKSEFDIPHEFIEKAYRADPYSLSALGALVYEKAEAGESGNALRLYREWLALCPPDSFTLAMRIYNEKSHFILMDYGLGLIDTCIPLIRHYALEHDSGRTDEYLSRLLENKRLSEDNYLRLTTYLFTISWNLSLKLCEEGIVRFPNSVKLRTMLAHCYSKVSREHDAVEQLKRAVDLGSEKWSYINDDFMWGCSSKEREQVSSYVLSRKLSPEIIYGEFFSLLQSDPRKAIELGEKILKIDPEYYRIYYSMIILYSSDSQYNRALEEICGKAERTFQRWGYDPLPAEYYSLLADIFIASEKFDKALDLLGEEFQINRKDFEAEWWQRKCLKILAADTSVVVKKAKAGNGLAQHMLSKRNISWN